MTTRIESFDSLSLGRKAPALVDVKRDTLDETIMISFHNFSSFKHNGMVEVEQTRAEFREKDSVYALFVFQYPDSEVPDWWKDSILLWSSDAENKMKKRKENWRKLSDALDSGEYTSDDINEALINLGKKYSHK